MRNRRTKKILREYPQLLDNSIVLSSVDVERIIASADYILSFEELIERAKRRFPQFGPKCWKEIDIAIQSHKKTIGRERKQFTFNYRIALASIALIIILFFTCIPAGRTMAQAVYNYIVNVLGSSMTIIPEDSQNEGAMYIPQSTASPRIIYSSIDQFSKQTGYAPFDLNAEWLILDEICGEYVPELGQYVSITYVDENGNHVWITQEWHIGNPYAISTDAENFQMIEINSGHTLYASISPVDETLDGTIVLEDSLVTICAEKEINHAELLALLTQK